MHEICSFHASIAERVKGLAATAKRQIFSVSVFDGCALTIATVENEVNTRVDAVNFHVEVSVPGDERLYFVELHAESLLVLGQKVPQRLCKLCEGAWIEPRSYRFPEWSLVSMRQSRSCCDALHDSEYRPPWIGEITDER